MNSKAEWKIWNKMKKVSLLKYDGYMYLKWLSNVIDVQGFGWLMIVLTEFVRVISKFEQGNMTIKVLINE